MKAGAIRAWSWVHKWSSLVSTIFLLMLCVTGLPLVFSHELDHWLLDEAWAPANPEGEMLDLDIPTIALSLQGVLLGSFILLIALGSIEQRLIEIRLELMMLNGGRRAGDDRRQGGRRRTSDRREPSTPEQVEPTAIPVE